MFIYWTSINSHVNLRQHALSCVVRSDGSGQLPHNLQQARFEAYH